MKLKTHKTTAKRIRLTGTGKVVSSTNSAQHLRQNKSKRQLAYAKKMRQLSKGMSKRFKKLVPYL